jgi:two-component system response regulator CssR
MRVADRPNLWILDADGEEGFNLMRAVREDSSAVGIILTAERERIVDRVLGLELGCDDFVVKPFSPRELILRAKRVLERAEQTTKTLSHLIRIQDYWLDLNRRVAVLDNQPVELTSKEFEALLLFARHRGMVLSRKQIIHHVWGADYFGSDRVVDDLIRRMRKKLEGLEVEAMYGYGYRITS